MCRTVSEEYVHSTTVLYQTRHRTQDTHTTHDKTRHMTNADRNDTKLSYVRFAFGLQKPTESHVFSDTVIDHHNDAVPALCGVS